MNFLNTIINAIGCVKHGKIEGEPCFTIPAAKNDAFQHSPVGICNQRAKKFGCYGKISRDSLIVKSGRKR